MPQHRSKKILIYIFLFLFIGTINNQNLINFDYYNSNKIIVDGLDDKNNLKIKDDLDLLRYKNLFLLNELKVKEIIYSNKLVEKFSVFKKYPSTLDIKIFQTDFLAKVKKDDDIYFLGSNGKLIKSLDKDLSLPQIYGFFENKNFFELKKTIDQTNFNYKEIKNLFFFKSGRWDIETNSEILIKLPKKNLKKSLELAMDILEKDKKKMIKKIDLRQNNQIIINGS